MSVENTKVIQEVDEKSYMNRRLMNENEIFVALAHKKPSWKEYEVMLAAEKKISRRLLNILADKGADASKEKGGKNTYRNYLLGNSNFMNGEGVFFPKRHGSKLDNMNSFNVNQK